MDSAVSTSLIAAGAALGGVVIKMAYDAVIERLQSKRQHEQRFLDERKAVYDEFLRLNKDEFQYREALQKVTLITRAGMQVKPEVLTGFPASPMGDLVDSLERIRRIAHTHEVVQIAERVVRLHGDAATALRYYLQAEHLSYGLPLFLANRLGEDQVREFVAAYRRDLLLGPPKGAPKDFPIIDRGLPVSRAEAERILNMHLRYDPAAQDRDLAPAPDSSRPLTERDARLLESSEYRALIADADPSQ